MSVVPLDDDVLREEVMLGYKFGRLLLGVSGYYAKHDVELHPEFGHSHIKEETFWVGPEAQVAFLRSANAQVEMIGLFGAGAGTWRRWSTETEYVGTDSPLSGIDGEFVTKETSGQGVRLRWQLGLGVRFWSHPGFGIHLAGGILGDYRLSNSGSFAEPPVQGFVQAGLVGVLGAPTTAVTQKEPRPGSPDFGIALQSVVSSSPRAALDANLGLGITLHRLTLLVGVDVPKFIDFGASIPNLELQGTVFRSADRRLELFLSSSGGYAVYPSRPALRWKAAPGLRFWSSPGVAFTGAVGVLGETYDKPYDHGDPQEKHHHLTMFGRIGILSVIGL
ncbi:hypothetical protein [Polyangium jinanense]|nr:hypothetical protein [Polyangium jinanense]MDC3958868.1 hypothetical protein [Polyangium jinanense]